MAGSDETEVFLQTLAKVHIVPGYVDTYLLKRNRDVYTLAGQKIVVSQVRYIFDMDFYYSKQKRLVVYVREIRVFERK